MRVIIVGGGIGGFTAPMVDRGPLDTWTYEWMTLLGDAAHPMYQVGSNGASQAILDVRAIGDALADELTIEGALARYEAESAEYKQVAGLLRGPAQRTCIPPSTSSTSPVQ